ncbi:hypothetical protein QO034_10505 [Sedimentitalea sp. JM2-8]|uniref:Phage protein D n=1 Tax=Sedimentitalea xiamensis TaxID=3050037 RepID=A0ABT7FEK9_9RHOB|nr:hypothetical protein [Sedimentitalea xiamensis]MDK3073543.1 hypothetical protein [Sedimentitalea xiamensis]
MPAARFAIYRDDMPLGARAAARLTELDLRQGDDAIGVMRLRFSLAQGADGTYPLLDAEGMEPGTKLSLSLAAPGGSDQRVFTGYLAYLRPHFEAIEANSYLDIVAHDPAILLNAEERVASYPDASDTDAAEEILGRYGLAIDAGQSDVRSAEDDQMLIQRGTDWAFLNRLAERNGFAVHFTVDPTDGTPKCYFGPPDLAAEPQADLTVLRENANLTWIDFQVAHDRPARRVGAAIDTLAKRLVRVDTETSVPVLGERLFAQAAADGLARAASVTPVRFLRGAIPRDTALNAQAAGQMAADSQVIEARGELDPGLYRNLLRPHAPVLIKGVGDRLSGVYYVRSVRTLMQQGELTQTFVAVSNALGRTGQEDFGRSAEEEPAA